MILLVSQLKYDIVWMTANFLDVLIINADSINFLLSIKPDLYRDVLIALALVFVLVIGVALVDRSLPDPARPRRLPDFGRVPRRRSAACRSHIPQAEWEAFVGDSYVSKFVRSGVVAVSELMQHGYMESEAAVTERLQIRAGRRPARRPASRRTSS